MQFEVITWRRQAGTSKVTKQPYDIFIVGGIVKTKNGEEFAEVILQAEHNAAPERGKAYHLEVSVFADREKKLQFRVDSLRPVVVEPVRKTA